MADNTQVHHLEAVTHEVDSACAADDAANGMQFGDSDAGLGNARTAPLAGGGLVGVRTPLRATEEPLVRLYWLVDEITSSVRGGTRRR